MSGTTPINGLVTPELEDAPADIEVAVGVPLNQLDVLLNPVFTSPAQRDAIITAPTEGMEAYCASTKEKYVYTGTQWVGMRPRVKRKQSASYTQSSVVIPDSDISMSLEANSHYNIYVWILFLSSATADFRYKFTVPTGASGAYVLRQYEENQNINTTPVGFRYWEDAAPNGMNVNTSILNVAEMTGPLTTVDAGTFQFYWGQAVTEVFNTTLFFNSFIRVSKVEI